jgi:hypothetical protein
MMRLRRVGALLSGIGLFVGISFGGSALRADEPAEKPPAEDGTPAAAASPSGEVTGAAKVAYDAAMVLYADGDFTGALLGFQRAYDLSDSPNLLWNMALCEKKLSHYARAIRLLERYQIEGGERLTDKDRAGAAFLSEKMKSFVSTLRVTVNEPGASVLVDDEVVGTTPLAKPLLIDMGLRRVRVVKKRFVTFDERRQVVGGIEVTINVRLEEERHDGRLLVIAAKDDQIWLDGKPMARGRFDGTVASGGHSLRVTAAGMKPYQAEIIVQEDRVRTLQVTLEPESKAGLPTWLVATGASVLAIGVGFTTGYLLFKAGEEPERARGNLAPFAIELGR